MQNDRPASRKTLLKRTIIPTVFISILGTIISLYLWFLGYLGFDTIPYIKLPIMILMVASLRKYIGGYLHDEESGILHDKLTGTKVVPELEHKKHHLF